MTDKPPHLNKKPCPAVNELTLDELRAEHDYWVEKVRTAPGFASAYAAETEILRDPVEQDRGVVSAQKQES